jgi:SPP1 family phage portal protein
MKMINESFIEFLRENSVNSKIIKDAIEAAESRRTKQQLLYANYRANLLKINSKTAVTARPNSKLNNDFRGEIIDQKTGFSFGVPIAYRTRDLEDEALKGVSNYDKFIEAFNEFILLNSLSYLDIETAKLSGICGNSGRLLYLDNEKRARVMLLPPWEYEVFRDKSVDVVVYAMRYYKMINAETKKDYWRVEWYDSEKVYFFNEVDGYFAPDADLPEAIHGFSMVPIIDFPNKSERLGDFEKVENLIDAYDFVTSFNQDEIEEFRNAYLKFVGVDIDKDFITKMRELGGIELPEGADADWLIKKIDGAFIENHLKRLKSNIYRFSKTVDMSDENFSGGNISGEARKWKLKSLADDAIIKERMFERSARKMFEVLATYWNIFKIPFSQSFFEMQFTQNIPVDLDYHATVTGKLKGNVSEKTRLSLLPFISDVNKELEEMENEQTDLFNAGESGAGGE